jgi:predicted DCC family thiol-disulfide oxidoreductase YuxK
VARGRSRRKFRVYYDGQCAMCTALMGSVRASEKGHEFELCDMHAEPDLPFDKAAVAREIHVVDRQGAIYRGAEAILRILGEYPRWSLIARLGQSPLVRPVLPLGYAVVAANRRFLFGPTSRIFWLKTTALIAFCLGLLISSPLWIGPRSYPLVPVWSGLPSLGHPIDYVLYGGLLALAAAALVSPRPQKFIGGFLAIFVVFCLLDQNRWQPWVFLYGFLLAGLALFSWRSDDRVGRQAALNIARLIVAFTYVFSGLQKINRHFVTVDFGLLTQPITDLAPALSTPLHYIGMAAPFVQVGFGIGLLTQRFRRASLVLAVAMHLFILAMLGPLGQDWNMIVWPWTAAMVVFDLLLFAGKDGFSGREIFRIERSWFHGAILVLFGCLPLLSFANRWDSYLSAALYSGNLTEALIYVSDAGYDAVPAEARRYFAHTSDNTHVLNMQQWAVEDLNVPPYPEARLYKAIARNLCAKQDKPGQLVLIVTEQRMLSSSSETAYRCDQL